ncbi:MAG: cysteine synthase A [Candidatus Tectomicrobia bacterium]|nr:cysteine synthase A [Candidatus Tectomicrobia bacterium]
MRAMVAPVGSVSELIGRTPLVQLRRLPESEMAAIFAKVEFFNPGGSVKDRIALSMIEDAERKGLLQPGDTIIEPTSGNTGIGLAMVGASKGYRVVIVLSESMSYERRSLLASYGAEVELTPADTAMQGSIDRAEELCALHKNYFMPMQFNNPANPEIHRRTTAKEILRDMGGMRIDAFVAGIGTGGTITGVGEVLKGRYPEVRIIGVEPETSAVLSGRPAGDHKIQGIGAGFIPKVLNVGILDEVLTVSDDDAYHMSKRLARTEGLMVGISSGAACHAALRVAQRLGRGKNVVVVFPDTGERYFSFDRYF